MNLGKFTEKELDFMELEEEMQLLPWQEEQRDDILAEMIAYRITEELQEKDPVKSRFASSEEIKNLAKKLVNRVGYYQVVVMPYKYLMQVVEERPNSISRVGRIWFDNYFALYDSDARTIGVHIPKSPLQKQMGEYIGLAIRDLKEHLSKTNSQLDVKLENALRKQLWNRANSDNVLPIKIKAMPNKLTTYKELTTCNPEKIKFRNGRRMEFLFKDSKTKTIMYYHEF